MNKKPTIRDIAEICGCSANTVSQALRGSTRISQALRERIAQVANDIGYIPNRLAESMRTGTTKTIAVIFQDFRNPFFAVLARFIEEYARTLGYFVLFATTSESAEQEVTACRTVLGRNVDGILFSPIQRDTKAVKLLLGQKTPFVLLGRKFQGVDAYSVIADDEQGAYLTTRHLLERGAREILFLNSFSFICTSQFREQGYLRALKEYGSQPHILEVSMEYGKTREALKRLYQKPQPYDAVLTFCDMMGFEAYYTLREIGRRVPGDILLAGMDGMQRDFIYPISLTSAVIDRKALAEKAMDMLLMLMENQRDSEKPLPEQKDIVIPQTLFFGQTT